MATARALDSNNDIFVLNGRIAMVDEGSQVVQHVRTRLQFYLEEWFLDLSAGTSWYQEIFVKPINLNNIESILKTRITLTPELESITEFSMELGEPNTRQLKVSFSAETIHGVINQEEIFING